MSQASNRWGVELNGSDEDRKVWRTQLKPPFDPFVEEVEDHRGNYLALRSSAFDQLTTPAEVHDAAKQLFRRLNVVMSETANTDPVTNGPTIEFVPDSVPRKHHHVDIEGATIRVRLSSVELKRKDAQGNVIEPLPAPSRVQKWMRAAALEPDIASALSYLEGKPGWFELFKAYEAVEEMPNGRLSGKEIERFKRTANVGNRHHPNPKKKPHKRPMELWEARSLITQWVSAAIAYTLAKNPESGDL